MMQNVTIFLEVILKSVVYLLIGFDLTLIVD